MRIVEHELDLDRLKAVGDKLIALVDPLPERSQIIYIPDFGGRKPVTGTVVSVGSRVSSITVGQRIFFTRFNGREFHYGDKKYQIMTEEQVFGILTDNLVQAEELAGTHL